MTIDHHYGGLKCSGTKFHADPSRLTAWGIPIGGVVEVTQSGYSHGYQPHKLASLTICYISTCSQGPRKLGYNLFNYRCS